MTRGSAAILWIAALLAACGGGGSGGATGRAAKGIGFHDLNGDGQVVVLCFGDSITRGFGDNDGRDPSDPPGGFGGYPLRLQQLAPRVAVVNAGVGGERTSRGMNRLPPTIQQTHPDYVILDEGINDLGDHNPDNALNNLQTMIETIFQSGAMPLIGTLLPTCCNHERSEPPGQIGDFNQALVQMARNDGIPVIDFHAAFTQDPFGPVDESSGLVHVPEGLHPTPHGYDVMARTAFGVFE